MKIYTTLVMLTVSLFSTEMQAVESGNENFNIPASVTVQVLDENGNAKIGEEVCVSFLTIDDSQTQKLEKKTGKSKNSGEFHAESLAAYDSIGAEVGKYGTGEEKGVADFYRSGCLFTPFRNPHTKHWEPWNPVIKLPVRKKVKPVPMFAKKINLVNFDEKQPEAELPNHIAFDIIKGEFCPPLGTGVTEDFVLDCQKKDNKSTTVRLSFPNESDGIILLDSSDSRNCLPIYSDPLFRYDFEFKGPRIAPSMGYGNFEWKNLAILEKNIFYTNSAKEKNSFYVFRVRSKKNKDGDNVTGFYGKIRDGINFSVNSKGFIYISFNYYYNPDGTKNLEFDPKKNLNHDEKTGCDFTSP